MPDRRDQDARHAAMMRAFERLRAEIAEQSPAERSLARQLALELVERALSTERTLRPGSSATPGEARRVLAD